MKKRKLIILICGLALTVCAAISSIGLITSASSKAGWSEVSIQEEYVYKSVIDIRERTYTVGANTYTASSLLYFPDGTVSEEKQAVLNQVGIYSVKYSVLAGDKAYADSKSFTVNYPHYDVTSEKSSISYATPDRATTVGVVAKLVQNDTLSFTQYIDFTKIQSTDNLVKGYVIPDVAGVNDFTELVFTFTDSVDSSVNFKVHYYAYDWAYNTYVAANGQNQVPVGIHQTQGKHENDGSGLWSYVSFKSADRNGIAAPDATQFFISMNYAEKKVFSLGYPDVKTEVVDLDDLSVFKDAWTGFPSGKARLSVDAYNYTGATATICITEVYGLSDLSNNVFIDNTKPTLNVDNEYSDNMPSALKGYSYTIPEATAYDDHAYDCKVKVSVWYNYGMENSVSVPVKDGKFVTDKVGTYGILYEAYDKVGNHTSEVRYVVAYEETPDFSFDTPADAVKNAKLGEWVEVASIDEANITGGSGKKTVTEFIEINGQREQIFGGFRATETGVYKVIYQVTDFVGKTSEKSYDVTVTLNNEPVLEKDFDVYPVYISGGEYVIPEYYAYFTKDGKLVRELCAVKIEDGTGTKTCRAGEKVALSVKNNADVIKFTVMSNGSTLAVHEAVGITAWMQEEAGNRFHLENYLVGEGFSTEKTSNGMILTAVNDQKMSFVFGNALSSRHITATFGGFKGITQNSRFKINIYDATDKTVGVSLVLGGKDAAFVETEGVRHELTGVTFDENCTFTITYTNNKITVNGTEIALKKFGGFDNEKVFLEAGFSGYGENAGLTFISVGNCNFNTAQSDRFAPIITSTHETGGVQVCGSEYTLYSPIAYDVYSPNLEYSLTVFAPDGSFAKDINGVVLNKVDPTVNYVIRLSYIGEYKVEYVIAEAKNFLTRQNKSSLKYTLIIVDEDAPELIWKGSFPTELTVGDTFIVPEYEVSDNHSSKENIIVRVFVETPASQLIMLPGNSIQMTHEGVYEIRIMVVDEAGNINNIVKHITVKRA